MELKRMDDRELITLYISGNEKAFETLLMRHKDKIYRFVYMKVRCQDLAHDIFQETFVKVINKFRLQEYNEEGKFLPWAMRIAHNLVIDHFRKTSRVKMVSESSSLKDDYSIFNTLSQTDKNVQEKLITDELESQMVHLIDYLPAAQKSIIQMRIFQDMSFKEIAEIEDISINTALGRMRYALMNMRKIIEQNNICLEF
jgi:RNA polymerase sigma-70 factor (ECF subfamily)